MIADTWVVQIEAVECGLCIDELSMIEAVVAAAVANFAMVESAAITAVSLDVQALGSEMEMVGLTFGSKDIADQLGGPFSTAYSFASLLFHESMYEILGHLYAFEPLVVLAFVVHGTQH